MHLVASKLGRLVVGFIAASGMAVALAGTASAASPTGDILTTAPAQSGATISSDTSSQVTVSTSSHTVSSTGGTGSDVSGGGPIGTVAVQAEGGTATNTQATVAAAGGSGSTGSTTDQATGVSAPAASTAFIPTAPISSANPLPMTRSLMRHAQLVASAVSMPSSPVQLASLSSPLDHPTQPQPPKSDGLLGTLTMELAGVVVPQLGHALGAAGSLPFILFAIILCSLAILVSLVDLSYGHILRRSGFATAARSDVGTFTFATPHLMNYVPAMVT